MREFITLLDQLNESTGLAGRKSGDIFKNENGDEATFDDIKFFPEGGGKYTPEELDQALAEIEQQVPNIQWQNGRSARTGAFALVLFDAFVIGKYLQEVKPSKADNHIKNIFIVDGSTYKLGGAAAEKSDAGLSPQDLLTDKINLTIPQIMNQLAIKLGTDNPLYAVAHNIAIGQPLPMTFKAPEGVSFTAFRDYFCEILQPIALQKGQYTGNAGDAANKFLGGSFQNTLISFDQSKTAGLSDSVLTNREGGSILVSTKGGKGATASTSNLIDQIDKIEQTPDGKKFLQKHQEIVTLLREIKAAGQAGAPLMLGIRYNIISPNDAEMITAFRKIGPVSMDNLDQLGLSKNLLKLAKSRTITDPDNVNLYYHLTAAVAFKAAEEVNEKTKFSAAAADILNNGALVQMYTKATGGSSTWTLQEFDTIYPGSSIKGVFLDAGKNYYSTDIKGNYTFKIDKGSGVAKDKEETPAVGREKRTASSLEKSAKDIVNPTQKPRETGTRKKRKK
jgi:hypothetical protein